MKQLKRRRANNAPVKWEASEEKKLLSYIKKKSFDAYMLTSLFPGRSLPSIRSKVRKLRIKHDLFGASYRSKKEDFTVKIAKSVKPNVVFDAYAGAGHQTFKWITIAKVVYASEIVESKQGQFEKSALENGFKRLKNKKRLWIHYKKGDKQVFFFSGDAVAAAADLMVNGPRIDLIDLDTCGSTLPTLPTLLTLLKPKHIVITHGEFHSMRFKREDVLRRLLMHRDIKEDTLPMDVDEMSKELDKAVKTAALRAHNETQDSFWLTLESETWLGGRLHGMLRRYYKVLKPAATADCINELSNS